MHLYITSTALYPLVMRQISDK